MAKTLRVPVVSEHPEDRQLQKLLEGVVLPDLTPKLTGETEATVALCQTVAICLVALVGELRMVSTALTELEVTLAQLRADVNYVANMAPRD